MAEVGHPFILLRTSAEVYLAVAANGDGYCHVAGQGPLVLATGNAGVCQAPNDLPQCHSLMMAERNSMSPSVSVR